MKAPLASGTDRFVASSSASAIRRLMTFGRVPAAIKLVEIPQVSRADLPDFHAERPQDKCLVPSGRDRHAHQVNAVVRRPIGKLFLVTRASSWEGDPATGSVPGIEVVKILRCTPLPGSRGKASLPITFRRSPGFRTQGPVAGRVARLDFQVDLLIRGVIGEVACVRFPPGLPSSGLPGEGWRWSLAVAGHRCDRCPNSSGSPKSCPVIFRSADDFTFGPAEMEVRHHPWSVPQVVFLHKFRERRSSDDQSVVAAARKKRLRHRPDQCGDSSRVADGSPPRNLIVAASDFRSSGRLGADLRHGVPPDRDELTHQRAPQRRLVDRVIELAESRRIRAARSEGWIGSESTSFLAVSISQREVFPESRACRSESSRPLSPGWRVASSCPIPCDRRENSRGKESSHPVPPQAYTDRHRPRTPS